MRSKVGKATTASNMILSQWEHVPHDDYQIASKKTPVAADAAQIKELRRMLEQTRPKEKQKKAEMSDAQKESVQVRKAIDDSMVRIEQRTAFRALPIAIRMRKQKIEAAGKKKIDVDKLDREIEKELKNKCGAAFKTLSRDDYVKATTIKAQAPPIGMYNARFTYLDANKDHCVPYIK